MSSPMQNTRSSTSISSYIASVMASISVFGVPVVAPEEFTMVDMAPLPSLVAPRSGGTGVAGGASLQAVLPALERSGMFGFVPRADQERRHGNGAPRLVDGDERQERGARPAARAGIQVLGLDVDLHLDRRVRRERHAGREAG